MKQTQQMWDYYYNVALRMGLKEQSVPQVEKFDRENKLATHQSNYSVARFYESKRPKAHGADQYQLLDAFLGDEDALARIRAQMKAPCPYTDDQLAPLFSRDAPLGSDAEQARAVRRVLSQPIAIVQGPPGTGKTKTIANIVSCITGLTKGTEGKTPTIAIVSTNKEAVRTALDGICGLHRMQDSPETFSLQNSCARLGNSTMRKAFCNSLNLSERRHLGIGKNYRGGQLPRTLLDHRPIFGCTLHSLYKCFEGKVDAFDYVIVDEGSQVPNYLGLIALRYARHLIVLGDVKQIPPIVPNDRMRGIHAGTIDQAHKEGGDRSFIQSCQEVFGQPIGCDGNVMLRQHFRCHPGIIGFCNQYVYVSSDGVPQLVPMERNAEGTFVPAAEPREVPMRVVWYEGTYVERLGDNTGKDPDPTIRPKMHNMRQVMIFVNEEWPRVKRLVREGKSLCVLSPYRAPLAKIKEVLEERGDAAMGRDRDTLVIEGMEGAEESQDLFQLTVHRSQGKGYDVIYFLTVDDDTNCQYAPWSQKEYLINVAVSRAREEFCCITSSLWLPREYVDEVGAWRPTHGWEHEHAKDQGAFTLKKLMRYVYKNRDKAYGDHGFHKAQTNSCFDKIPQLRRELREKLGTSLEDRKPGEFAPPQALYTVLTELVNSKDYELKREYRISRALKHLPHETPVGELKSYIDNKAAFDFAILKAGHPLMAVEVDGEYHREHTANIGRDQLKERIVTELLHGATYGARPVDDEYMGYIGPMRWEGLTPNANFALIRIPTNGETHDEYELLKHLLEKFEGRD